MKKLKLMDSSGDTVLEFDEAQAEAAATLEAKALFERMAAKGAAVFSVNRGEGQPDLRVKDFEQLGSENVIVPAIVAG
jgi:hypothetical protein